MNIIDIVIIILLAFGALLGFKRGFTRELVSFVGIFVIVILSFLFKNPVSIFLYNNLPFFNYGGIFKDMTVINILVYETIAFFVVFFVLTLIFKTLLTLTNLFEKVLKATIILGIFSKFLGAILGAIQSLVYIFIILFILKLPVLDINIINDSNIANKIMNKTPLLGNICNDTLSLFEDVYDYKYEYDQTGNYDDYNKIMLNRMIDKKIITRDNAKKLIDKGKIKGVVLE